ncbi:MAG: bifunctional oligoribonuclease/PAP phosphatase NrnA [Planctomycetota bacterium]|nr:bifunctional oligoribonuclease/PAP phosphatase NrnA [Planctomycetota bacterium]
MESYATNTTWAEIADRIRGGRRIALVTHAKPDGDALGSQLALARALSEPGRTADVYVMGPLEHALAEVIADTPVHRADDRLPGDDHDLVIVVDTGAWSQLQPLETWLRERRERTIVIDHHSHGDDVAALRMVDPGAAATAQMIVSLLDELGCALTEDVAEALYVGIATDTGWFRFDNVSAQTFAVAARLLECGVDKSRLYQVLEENYPPGRLALEARALASVQYARDGAVAIQSLSLDDFQQTGCAVEDLTNLVNRPMVVGKVRVSILLSESKAGVTKLSFRSKPTADGSDWTDVNRLARQFGGGGHVFAAGARMSLSLAEARRAVLAAVEG